MTKNKTNKRVAVSLSSTTPRFKPVPARALEVVVGGIMWCRHCGGICRE